jgi:hypothetical protein
VIPAGFAAPALPVVAVVKFTRDELLAPFHTVVKTYHVFAVMLELAVSTLDPA